MATRKNKTRAELEAENRLLRHYRRSDNWAGIANNVIRWSGSVGIFFMLYLIVDALAGKQTGADIGISFLTDFRVSTAVAWLMGVSGVAYGVGQKTLRGRDIERLQGRNQQLERTIDPNRSSSGLTSKGNTRPEDE